MNSIVDRYAGTNYDPFVQLDILDNGTRDDIIAWLCWNDANGCYTDTDSDLEGLPRLTLDDAREIMSRQIDG